MGGGGLAASGLIVRDTVTVGFVQVERRYFVVESDIPGLTLEADTYEELVEAAQDAAPDLVGGSAAGAKVLFQQEIALAS